MIIGIMRVNSKQCAAREILYFGTIQEIELPYIVKGEMLLVLWSLKINIIQQGQGVC